MNDKNSVEVDTVLESSNAYALKEARICDIEFRRN